LSQQLQHPQFDGVLICEEKLTSAHHFWKIMAEGSLGQF